MKGILIAGMKHSGKSTLARMLAWEMKARYFDLDDLVEEAYRSDRMLSCREIYVQHGKTFFMELELEGAHHLASSMKNHSIVASLGGGTIENTPAIDLLSDVGVLVYLRVDEDVLFKRISRGGLPPFLSKEHPKEDFAALYKKRTRLLENRADVTVNLPDDEIPNSLKRLVTCVKEFGYAW